MPIIHEFAPAKLNLYLHITGRRADGYHDLDSLVAFASVGDQIRLEPASAFSFTVEGPQAAALQNESPDKNLAVQAVRSLAELMGRPLDFKMTLVKNLPVASGIGGGSSDAAAALRSLAKHWRISLDHRRILEAAKRHGQDVPACLVVQNNYLTAEGVAPAPDLPHVDCVLVNPGKGLPTPAVYQAYRESDAIFSPHAQLREAPGDVYTLAAALAARRNESLRTRLPPDAGDPRCHRCTGWHQVPFLPHVGQRGNVLRALCRPCRRTKRCIRAFDCASRLVGDAGLYTFSCFA